MARYEPTGEAVATFLEAIPNPQRRDDAKALCAIIERAVGEPPEIWAGSMIGFGRYPYRYESGREGDAGAAGFAPRAKELVVYLPAHSERTPALLERLGKHKAGVCCLYIKKLSDVDEKVLTELVVDSYHAVKEKYPDPAPA